VPDNRPDITVLVPVPEVIILPGDLVSVQLPDEGKPFNVTLPVDTKQVGCVIRPIVGAVGKESTLTVVEDCGDGPPQPFAETEIVAVP
jgi:hypothetical protein